MVFSRGLDIVLRGRAATKTLALKRICQGQEVDIRRLDILGQEVKPMHNRNTQLETKSNGLGRTANTL